MSEFEYEREVTVAMVDKTQFERMADELLKNWTEYKKLKSRMELLDASCKKYMCETNMKTYENEHGALMLVHQSRRVLNRALIEDIEKYKSSVKFSMLYKNPSDM